MSDMTINEAVRFVEALPRDISEPEVTGAKLIITALAAPLIGFVFVVALPLIGLGYCAWHGVHAVAGFCNSNGEFRAAKSSLQCIGSPRA